MEPDRRTKESAMSSIPAARTPDRPHLNGWARAAVALLFANSAAFAYLVVRSSQNGEQIARPVPVIMALSALLGIALAATGRRVVCGLAAALLVVGFAGSVPHDLGNLLNGPGTERHIFGGVAFLVSLSAAIIAIIATWRFRDS
jgi:hypothetical protein